MGCGGEVPSRAHPRRLSRVSLLRTPANVGYTRLPFRTGLNPWRLVSDGIPLSDCRRAEEIADSDAQADWLSYWSGVSSEYEAHGRRALAEGHRVSAGQWLWLASLTAHYAQFIWFHEPDRKEVQQRRKVALYRDASPNLLPPATRLDVRFEATSIPSYLRLPTDSVRPVPCVILIGGLDSTKEDAHLFEDLFLERGVATLSFDGPGQGEMFFDLPLAADFHRYTSAVIDRLVENARIDSSRVAAVGRSLGGHHAIRSAAADPRIRAVVSLSGTFDLTELDRMAPHVIRGFLFAGHVSDGEEGRTYLRETIDLSEIAPQLTCPTLIVHGRRDAIFSDRQLEKFRQNLTNASVDYLIEDHGIHCAHNLSHLVRPAVADWVAGKLNG